MLNNEIVGKPTISSEFDDRNTNEPEVFDGFIPEENFFHEYTEDTLDTILARQKQIINALKKHGQPKYLAVIFYLLF